MVIKVLDKRGSSETPYCDLSGECFLAGLGNNQRGSLVSCTPVVKCGSTVF